MDEGGGWATLGGGCFWCLEAVFSRLKGVHGVESGYCGGERPNPSYQKVCGGQSGHAEVVRIAFDPVQLSFRQLLEVFFAIHDPTTPDRQGHDVGSQYRSVIFCHSLEQEATARDVVAELAREGVFREPIVTQISPAPSFYPAEADHQRYFETHFAQPYCQFVVAPKLAKFRQHFSAWLKAE